MSIVYSLFPAVDKTSNRFQLGAYRKLGEPFFSCHLEKGPTILFSGVSRISTRDTEPLRVELTVPRTHDNGIHLQNIPAL